VGEVRRLAAHVEPFRRHRAITHLTIAVTALAVAVAVAIPAAPVIQAGLQTTPRTGSILPANVGIGVAGTDAVILHFPGPMDQAAVATTIGLSPATKFSLLWAGDSTSVAVVPSPRWAVDERYVIHLPAGTAMADGGALAADWRAAFTTQTAPSVTHLTVGGVTGTPAGDTPIILQEVMSSTGAAGTAPEDAATDDRDSPDVTADAPIGITFSGAMDAETTEAAFHIAPDVSGSLRWEGTTMWFQPDQRLAAGTRYTISLVGARDVDGNPLGGDVSLSFTTRVRAEAIKVAPALGARDVPATTSVRIVFTQPMATARTAAAFTVTDTATGRAVVGRPAWSADGRTMTFVPATSLGAGHTFAAALGSGAHDADGNPVTIAWRFTTAGQVVQSYSSSSVPVAAGSASMVQYALNQINAARASYGLGPLVVDSTITAVSYGHAADMLAYNYFSHSSRNGATYKQRLSAGGVGYGYSGENICYLGYGGGVQATLNWCHAQFWAEPFPGGGNHKDNILGSHFRRVGIGIAVGGNKVYVVWDYTD
jgi:uncharacterized protein YkwD